MLDVVQVSQPLTIVAGESVIDNADALKGHAIPKIPFVEGKYSMIVHVNIVCCLLLFSVNNTFITLRVHQVVAHSYWIWERGQIF